MNWETLDGINLFGIFLISTLGGFFIGYLMGYIWLHLEQSKVMKALGVLVLNGAGTELSNNDIHTANLQEPRGIGSIKFHSMPVGHHPWKQIKEYAQRA